MTRSGVFTVGHSSHSLDTFANLLASHGVTAVADVRSTPVSRFAPHFNKELLSRELASRKLSYVFLGRELGGRPRDPNCYVDGRIHYALLSRTPAFLAGLDRLVAGATRERIAVMCTEKDPLDCHRTLLVARQLQARGLQVDHILADGRVESHDDAMTRLMSKFGLLQPSFIGAPEELEEEAVTKQEKVVGYVDTRAELSSEG